MARTSYFYCLPYFTLPEFPSDCKIVKDNSLFLRDILCCYKKNGSYNPHIYWGGQYDPNYEYEMAPQFKMCHKPQRNRIKKLVDSGLYEKIFIIFRVNKRYLNKSNKHYLAGYYEIDQHQVVIDPNYEDATLFSSNTVFVDDNQAIDISDFLKKTGMYISRFNSETHGSKYHNLFLNYIDEINNMENRIDDYKEETIRLEKIFKYYEFEEGIYEPCIKCKSTKKCSLIKRIKYCKLYHNLPKKISEIINEHYKTIYNIEVII